jgi:hypothetical protein
MPDFQYIAISKTFSLSFLLTFILGRGVIGRYAPEVLCRLGGVYKHSMLVPVTIVHCSARSEKEFHDD